MSKEVLNKSSLKQSKQKRSNGADHGGVEVDHDRQVTRLRRIEGQVRGLQRMIDEKRTCLDTIHQISAIINALRRVQSDMLGDHLSALGEAIIAKNLSEQKRRQLAGDLAALLKQLS